MNTPDKFTQTSGQTGNVGANIATAAAMDATVVDDHRGYVTSIVYFSPGNAAVIQFSPGIALYTHPTGMERQQLVSSDPPPQYHASVVIPVGERGDPCAKHLRRLDPRAQGRSHWRLVFESSCLCCECVYLVAVVWC